MVVERTPQADGRSEHERQSSEESTQGKCGQPVQALKLGLIFPGGTQVRTV